MPVYQVKSGKTGKTYDMDWDKGYNPSPDDIDNFIYGQEKHTGLWDKLNTPLLSKIPVIKDMHPFDAASKMIDPEHGSSGLRSAASAYLEALGSGLEGLSSPLNLAISGAGAAANAAKPFAPMAAKALETAPRVFSGGTAALSAYQGVKNKDLSQIVPTVIGALGARKGGGIANAAEEQNIRTNPQTGKSFAGDAPVKVNPIDDVNPQTGEIIENSQPTPNPVPTPNPAPTAAPQQAVQLPKELDGAKPRFNMGHKEYIPTFENPVDKVAYILAQNVKSKRDADYLSWFVNNTGMTEQQARVYGAQVRSRIKANVTGQEPGQILIPDIYSKYKGINKTQLQNADAIKQVVEGKLNDSRDALNNIASIDAPADVNPISFVGGRGGKGGKPPVIGPDGEVIPIPENKTPKMQYPVTDAITRVGSEMKSAVAGVDLSAPLRQGRALMHKKEFWTSLKPMLQATMSDEGYQAVQDGIASHPLYETAKKSGVSFTDLGDDLSSREEHIAGNYVDKIPGVGKLYELSQAAYTAFLNKLRMDTFASMMEKAPPDVDTKQVAGLINVLTGRGSLGKFEGAGPLLNATFFSPKFVSSRIKLLSAPISYINADPYVRKEALKAWAWTVGSQATAIGLAQMAGMKGMNNPINPDFGKFRAGNTRVDSNAGLQQVLRSSAQLASGKVQSSQTGKTFKLDTGKFGSPTTGKDVVYPFFANREAPLISYLMELKTGKDNVGNDVSIRETTARHMIPMMLQDAYDIYQDDPKHMWAIIPSILGASVQTYQPKNHPKKLAR